VKAWSAAVLATVICEGVAAVAWMRGGGAPVLVLHVAACAWIATLLHRRVFDGSATVAFALIFSTTFFVPFLGELGLLAVATLARSWDTAPEPECVRTRIPRPPQSLEPPGERQTRIEALTALGGRSDPAAIAALRRAMQDRDEDVRLLAHALLESKSRVAWRDIAAANELLLRAPGRAVALRRRLACLYWEVAWLGLAQGECLDHALVMARQHALAGLEHDPRSAPLHLLLGRIELRLGAPERAELALLKSNELGFLASATAPYLAEAAFLRRRFDRVRSHLAGPRVASGGAAAQVRRFWT
jgi:hypothetical protein